VAVNAPEAGIIREFLANEEDTVTVGQDLVRIELGGEPSGDKPAGGEAKAAPKEPTETQTEQKKAPEPKPEETKAAAPPAPAKEQAPAPKQPSKPAKAAAEAPATLGNREERRVSHWRIHDLADIALTRNLQVKMNRMRLRIAERLKQSQNTAASLTTFNEVDMSGLMEFRSKYKDEVLKNTGVKLGFMSAFSRACVLAMRDIPAVNASIEGPNGGDTIVYRDYVDISVAVATEKGLVTPVVRNVEGLDMVGIEKSIADMGKKV
jgi:2-oxoglutarate dehydrogenase E2 component (dihydrolipoamide succinyltransferase)